MEAPFKIGQKVVCVKTLNWDDIKINSIYTVLSVKRCCNHWAVDVGIGRTTSCRSCHKEYKGRYKSSICFAPIEDQKERIRYVAVSETLREKAVEVAAIETN